MKLPRKGILIRLGIYLPVIIGLVVWRACVFEREEMVIEQASDAEPKGRVRTMQGPDGKEMKIIEITPEEARAMGVEVPPTPAAPAAPPSPELPKAP